eukprot:TRINITY_DN7493_c0_g1_i1.p2 TRINITY_DN7493_c0_g1~~TRINITY_DN7493_c0_g1_i1.p2  ORF type:complete len:74 (-),score=9.92 TRINITY_DN7493_c0_g1_i1:14-235(-)
MYWGSKIIIIKAELSLPISSSQPPLPPKLEKQKSKHFKIVIDPKRVAEKKYQKHKLQSLRKAKKKKVPTATLR